MKLPTKRMVDLSTSHFTKEDRDLMADRHGYDCSPLPRIVQHAYGFIVFVCSDKEALQWTLDGLIEEGFSAAFIAIYKAVAELGDDLILINFDQDADVIEGLPTFEW